MYSLNLALLKVGKKFYCYFYKYTNIHEILKSVVLDLALNLELKNSFFPERLEGAKRIKRVILVPLKKEGYKQKTKVKIFFYNVPFL